MSEWVHKLLHDHEYFARWRTRIYWVMAGYLLILGLWTGYWLALLKDPLGVMFFHGHEGGDAVFSWGLMPAFYICLLLFFLEQVNKA